MNLLKRSARTAALGVSLVLCGSGLLTAQSRCTPCTGVSVEDPIAFAALLDERDLGEDPTLFVRYPASLERPIPNATLEQAERIAASGAVPAIAIRFGTPAPLLDNAAALEVELQHLAELARRSPPETIFQLGWQSLSATRVADYSFLIKRAAVAISGAQPEAAIVSASLGSEFGEAELRALFDQEVAAYLDGLAFRSADEARVRMGANLLGELDPGALLVIDGQRVTDDPLSPLVRAAELTEWGANVALFEQVPSSTSMADAFALIAREFQGDISIDPYSRPSGARAWSFVRGSDLGLRVVVEPPDEADDFEIEFTDPQLSSPRLLDLAGGEPRGLFSGRRAGRSYRLGLESGDGALLLALDRRLASSLEGVEGVDELVDVEDTRRMPVEEILRRLQAFEDDQARRIQRYSAVNTMSLRFQLGGGQSLDATFKGDFFFQRKADSLDGTYDWAWQEFFVNGIRWRGKTLPQIPLIQPEKATALPLAINFSREYRYRLRGTGTAEGRDCWVVDFEPAIAVEPGRSLYQGTVWIDREHYGRVKTRAVQLGLQGDVLSNDETFLYSPVNQNGQPSEWSPTSFWLPLRLVGQQIFSVLNLTTVVEREITLEQLVINPGDFDRRRQAVLASEATMVRDTDAGMRYLVPDKEGGGRVVQERLDPTRLLALGGVFWDESLDFPLPLAGVNWLSLDYRDTGTQFNILFGGVLLNAAVAKPDFLGSRFDAGMDVFALAVAGTDTVYRNDREVAEEDVESTRPNVDFSLGRPIGSFFKVDLHYSIGRSSFSRADDTAEDFAIPVDHTSHALSLTARYNRRGYRFRLGATHNLRSEWEAWGFADNPDFDPSKDEFTLWGAALGKTWHLPKFQKVGAEVEYVDGDNLDRFSKYQFGFFSDIRVHGYRQDKIRATDALAAHLSYGFDIGEVFRLDLVGDVASVNDDATGLVDQMLAGVGLVGTVLGPWQTIINIDVGVPVAGPEDGVSAFVAVLRLFN